MAMIWRSTPHSTSIRMAGYDATRHVMTVVYIEGATYNYYDVPGALWELYEEEIDADGSAGEFVNHQVKPYYKFEKQG